jgi:hypothetical protein
MSARIRFNTTTPTTMTAARQIAHRQPIATFRNRLDEACVFGVITQDSTQFRDGARQDVVSDKYVGPDGLYQTFFGDDLTGVSGKQHQYLHHLGFQANGTGRSSYAVQRWLDLVGLADAEGILQNRCSMPDYSTASEAAREHCGHYLSSAKGLG